MIIWGRPLMIDIYGLLGDVREEAIRKYKMYWLFSEIRNSGDDVFVGCPRIENHGGVPERTPSCSIHKETGMVHCFGCGAKDSIPGLIAKVLKLDDRIAGYRWILKKYTMPKRGERPLLGVGVYTRTSNKKFYIPEEMLELYAYDHPYMFKRNLTYDIIDWFDLGYDKELNAVTIPMRDVNNNIVFIKKRPIGRTKFHKYHIDEGVDKRELVFGLNLIKQNIQRVKMIYLSEGEFDAMSWYAIEKYGAGIQGDRLFPEQLKQLIRVARGIPICIATDNDKAGRRCREMAIPMLRPYFPLYEPMYPQTKGLDGKPKYKDPNDLLRKGLLQSLEIKPIE